MSCKAYAEYKDMFKDPREQWKLRRMIMKEKYAIVFGIFTQRELDASHYGYTVLNDKTNVRAVINANAEMKSYIENRVYEETGVDLISYVGLPDHIKESITKSITDVLRERDTHKQNILGKEPKI